MTDMNPGLNVSTSQNFPPDWTISIGYFFTSLFVPFKYRVPCRLLKLSSPHSYITVQPLSARLMGLRWPALTRVLEQCTFISHSNYSFRKSALIRVLRLMYTVDSEIFARILFSRIASKDILVM